MANSRPNSLVPPAAAVTGSPDDDLAICAGTLHELTARGAWGLRRIGPCLEHIAYLETTISKLDNRVDAVLQFVAFWPSGGVEVLDRFIEVDRNTESKADLISKLRRYVELNRYMGAVALTGADGKLVG